MGVFFFVKLQSSSAGLGPASLIWAMPSERNFCRHGCCTRESPCWCPSPFASCACVPFHIDVLAAQALHAVPEPCCSAFDLGGTSSHWAADSGAPPPRRSMGGELAQEMHHWPKTYFSK